MPCDKNVITHSLLNGVITVCLVTKYNNDHITVLTFSFRVLSVVRIKHMAGGTVFYIYKKRGCNYSAKNDCNQTLTYLACSFFQLTQYQCSQNIKNILSA